MSSERKCKYLLRESPRNLEPTVMPRFKSVGAAISWKNSLISYRCVTLRRRS